MNRSFSTTGGGTHKRIKVRQTHAAIDAVQGARQGEPILSTERQSLLSDQT